MRGNRKKMLSGILAAAMVVSMAGGVLSLGGTQVKAADGDVFTLYYHDKDSNADGVFMNVWDFEGAIVPAEGTTYESCDAGWGAQDFPTLQPVDGYEDLYSIKMNVQHADKNGGFTIYEGNPGTKTCEYDDQWSNADAYVAFKNGESEAYVVDGEKWYTSLEDAGLFAGQVDTTKKLAEEKKTLKALVDECAVLKKDWYTAKTWNVLSSALKTAKTVSGNDKATYEQAKKARIDLEKAKKSLMEVSVYVNKVENLSEDFMRGIDLSSYISVKESGAKFKNNDGKVLSDQEFFNFLAESGVNWVRLRVWNDPYDADGNGYGGGNNDIEKAVKMGQWATKAGMKVLIDFHYSDFWADPARQLAPKAWAGYTVEQTEKAVYDYTKECMNKLKKAGVNVGMVQIGNETNNGVAGVTGWENMCKIFSAGSKAVREHDKKILVAVHFTDPQTPGKLMEQAGALNKNKVDYDVFASSYYPSSHGTMSNITKVLSDVATTYNKKVIVAETAWAWTNDDGDGHGNTFNPGSYTDYPVSIQGQVNEVRDVIDAVNKVKNNAGIGVFYWEPTWIPAAYAYDADGKVIKEVQESNKNMWETKGSGWASSYSVSYDPEHVGEWYGGSVKDNEAFFDFEGNPLASLTVFKDVYTGKEAPVRRIDVVKNASVEVLLESADVKAEQPTIQAALPKSVQVIYNDNSKARRAVKWNTEELKEIKSFGNYEISGTLTYKNEFSKTVTKEVSCAVSVFPKSILKNGEFETEDGTGWKVGNAKNVELKWNDTPLRGTGACHFWSAEEMDFTLRQEVTVPETGYYCAAMQVQGEGGEVIIRATNKNGTCSRNATGKLSGWCAWQNPSTVYVYAKKGEKILVTVNVKGNAGAWGSIDDVFLYRVNHTKHVMRKSAEKVATAKEEGVKAHYTCKQCGRFSSDAAGKNALSRADLVIPKKGK